MKAENIEMVLDEDGKETEVELKRDYPVNAVFDVKAFTPYPFLNYNGEANSGEDEMK
jgi:hypothetical protein